MYITQIGNINFNVNVNATLLYLFFLYKGPKTYEPAFKRLYKRIEIYYKAIPSTKIIFPVHRIISFPSKPNFFLLIFMKCQLISILCFFLPYRTQMHNRFCRFGHIIYSNPFLLCMTPLPPCNQNRPR